MDFDPEDLPTDYDQLLALTRMLISVIKDKEALVLLLQHQIAKLERLAFGRRSEKATLELAQLRLMLGDLERPSLDEDDVTDVASCAGNDNFDANERDDTKLGEKRPATPRPRKPLPAPSEVVVHPVCNCPECGSHRLHKVGEDRRRIVERVPAVVKVIEHVRVVATAMRHARRRHPRCRSSVLWWGRRSSPTSPPPNFWIISRSTVRPRSCCGPE